VYSGVLEDLLGFPLIPTFIHFLPSQMNYTPLHGSGQRFGKRFIKKKLPIFMGSFGLETDSRKSNPQGANFACNKGG
jgi:hypothetical protein